MKVVLLRVGIDSGSGGIHGPLFQDGSFEYLSIPDGRNLDSRKYGNTKYRHDCMMVNYFPESRRKTMGEQSIHLDPEFDTFTYGDPTPPKTRLQYLHNGDLLVFYCGLQGWNFPSSPALYLMGYFEVALAGIASELGEDTVTKYFKGNFHVLHPEVYSRERTRLVLVKGGRGSRLLDKAVRISSVGYDINGRELKVISPEMRKVFGDFEGKLSLQRSPPRWVNQNLVTKASEFVKSLD